MSSIASFPSAGSGFLHSALIYRDEEDLCAQIVPYLRHALTLGQPVLAAVRRSTSDVVRAALGPDGAAIEWAETLAHTQPLGLSYEAFRRYLAAQAGRGRPGHVLSESDIGAESGDDRMKAYLSYESACNEILAPFGSPVLCLFDLRVHSAAALDGVRAVHQTLIEAGTVVTSQEYTPPHAFASARMRDPLSEPPRDDLGFDVLIQAMAELGIVRAQLRAWLAQREFEPAAVDDVVLAVVEVASNALEHAGTPARVRSWNSGDVAVVQVDDTGPGAIPPLAGFAPPVRPTQRRGRGLWMARQLADSLVIDSSDHHASVRLSFPRALTHVVPSC